MVFQVFVLFAGGVGTFLAAVRQDLWVAITTALATAFTSKLELDQVEPSLVQYNTALMSLRNIKIVVERPVSMEENEGKKTLTFWWIKASPLWR